MLLCCGPGSDCFWVLAPPSLLLMTIAATAERLQSKDEKISWFVKLCRTCAAQHIWYSPPKLTHWIYSLGLTSVGIEKG